MSASDIDKGSRWSNELAIHLQGAQFGLICLTQENLEAPWLLFEAGALSKLIDSSRVVPLLYGMSQAELQGPLAQFQAAPVAKDSIFSVIRSINEVSGESALASSRLESAFENWWPDLESALRNIPEAAEENPPPPRSDRDILEEVLHLCRQTSRRGPPVDSSEDLGQGNQQSPRANTLADMLVRLLAQQPPQPRLERDNEAPSDDK